MNPILCPVCEGRGDSVEGGLTTVCSLCEGEKKLNPEQQERYIYGQKRREERLRRQRSAQEEAARMGMKANQLYWCEDGVMIPGVYEKWRNAEES